MDHLCDVFVLYFHEEVKSFKTELHPVFDFLGARSHAFDTFCHVTPDDVIKSTVTSLKSTMHEVPYLVKPLRFGGLHLPFPDQKDLLSSTCKVQVIHLGFSSR